MAAGDETMTEAGQTGSMTPGLELQLMTTIAEMRADMRHVRETSDKTFETVNGLSTRVSNVEADVAVLKARPEIDSTLASRVAVAEAEITASKTIMSTVQSILESRSLSWPKLIAGLAAVVGTLVALGIYNSPVG
jgi:hypothetical protein